MSMDSHLTFKQLEEFKTINTIGYIIAFALYRSTKIIFRTYLKRGLCFVNSNTLFRTENNKG